MAARGAIAPGLPLTTGLHKILGATWQRCPVHFMRNALQRVPRKHQNVVAATLRSAFAQETAQEAHGQWRQVADSLRQRFPKLAELMDVAEHDVLAHMNFPKDLRPKLHSTNPLERLDKEIKRRTNVVGILSQRRGDPAPGRGAAAGTERRVGGEPPLHELGVAGPSAPR